MFETSIQSHPHSRGDRPAPPVTRAERRHEKRDALYPVNKCKERWWIPVVQAMATECSFHWPRRYLHFAQISDNESGI